MSEGPFHVNRPDPVLFFLVVMGGGLNSVANRYPGRNVGRGECLFNHRPRSLSIFLIRSFPQHISSVRVLRSGFDCDWSMSHGMRRVNQAQPMSVYPYSWEVLKYFYNIRSPEVLRCLCKAAVAGSTQQQAAGWLKLRLHLHRTATSREIKDNVPRKCD